MNKLATLLFAVFTVLWLTPPLVFLALVRLVYGPEVEQCPEWLNILDAMREIKTSIVKAWNDE